MKITEYPSITSLDNSNIFIVDGNSGTKTIKAMDAILAMLSKTSAKTHRMIFRGKNLGSGITTEQLASIQNGSFDDLWLGDYWVINNVTWRIVDFDYWLYVGDRDNGFTNHHIVLMPDEVLYTAQMNTSNTTAGGYAGSAMYTSNLANAKTIVNNAFGAHALSHRMLFVNAVTNGKPSAHAWYDSIVDLISECQLYGHLHFSVGGDGSSTIPQNASADKTQFALFMVAPEFISKNRDAFWLRDTVNASYFVDMGGWGNIGLRGASGTSGVRPAIAVG